MVKKTELTQEIVKELLHYEPDTGKLYWKQRDSKWFVDGKQPKEYAVNRWNSLYAGKEAFTAKNGNGYFHGTILKKTRTAHEIIGLIIFGELVIVDHDDGDILNNKETNIKKSDHSNNARNRAISSNNTSGCMGVYWHNKAKKWGAKITHEHKLYSLGLFNDYEEAVRERKIAEEKFGFNSNHGRNKYVPDNQTH